MSEKTFSYEERYNEALERARRIKNGEGNWRYSDLAEIIPALTDIFPELRESEDERMLNLCVWFLDQSKKCYAENSPIKDCIAWLEKQKESLHIQETCKENADSFTDKSEDFDEDVRKWLVGYFSSIKDTVWIHRNTITCEQILEWLEKQGENLKTSNTNMKLIDRSLNPCVWHDVKEAVPTTGRYVLAKDNVGNVIIANYGGGEWYYQDYDSDDKPVHYDIVKWADIPSEKQQEQKPAEWSEVELEFRGEKVKVKRPFFRDEKGRGYSTTEQDEDVSWSALRAWCEKKGISMYDLYPQAEWSEEDERNWNNVWDVLDGQFNISDAARKDACAWFKSLRSQPNKCDTCASRGNTHSYVKGYEDGKKEAEQKCNGCSKHLEGYISGRGDAENKLLEDYGAIITPEHEFHMKPRWKPSEEQMEALNYAIQIMSTDLSVKAAKASQELESIREQLKSL